MIATGWKNKTKLKATNKINTAVLYFHLITSSSHRQIYRYIESYKSMLLFYIAVKG